MKVSVLITTYNQDEFIAQALGSVLMQKVDFPFEVVIGEDASTDQTREIVLEFAKKYPDRVRVLLRDKADAERDRAAGLGGKGSFVNCLAACKGKYIALLDGDDYWTNPLKLKIQVDFLDQHPDFAISFHPARIINDETLQEAVPGDEPQPEVLTIEDLLVIDSIPACSAVFRSGLFGAVPDWYYGVTLGDWALHLMNAEHGKIGRINKVMAAYRVRPAGMWPSLGPERQRLEMIKVLDHVNAHLGFKYNRQINAVKAVWYYQLAVISFRSGKWAGTLAFLQKYLWLSGFKGAKLLLGNCVRRQARTLQIPVPALKEPLNKFY